MKNLVVLMFLGLAFLSCEKDNFASFGKKITNTDVVNSNEVLELFSTMSLGDTMTVKTSATIKEVCSKKGCWMTLDMEDGSEVMVRFKDYSFFMPLDAEGNVIINGKAYVAETSIEELRHYAEDSGKSAQNIAAITTPKRTYAFEADGVLLKK